MAEFKISYYMLCNLFSRVDKYETDHQEPQMNRIPGTRRGRKVPAEQEKRVAASGGQRENGQDGHGASRCSALTKVGQPAI